MSAALCYQILCCFRANFLHSETIWAPVSALPAHLHILSILFLSNFPDWKVNDHTSLFAAKYLRWSVLFLRQFYLSSWISFFSGLLFPFSPPHATVLIHYYTNIFSSCEPQYSQCILEWSNPFHLFSFSHTACLYLFVDDMHFTLSVVPRFSICLLHLSANLPHLLCIWLPELP